MPLGISSSRATDNRVTTTATDEAQIASNGGQVVNPNSLGVSGGSNLVTGLQIYSAGKNSPVQVTTADPEVLSNALSAMENSNISFGDAVKDVVSQQAASTNSMLSNVLSSLSSLSESKLTAGESGQNKTILYIVLGVLALLGLVAWLRK